MDPSASSGEQRPEAVTAPEDSGGTPAGGDGQRFSEAQLKAALASQAASLKAQFKKQADHSTSKALLDLLTEAGIEVESMDGAKALLSQVGKQSDAGKALEAQLKRLQVERDKIAAELQKRDREAHEARIRDRVYGVARERKALDPAVLYHTLRGEGLIDIDGDRLVLRNESGDEDPTLTLEGLVEQQLGRRPYLVAPTSTNGPGGGPNGRDPATPKHDLMTPKGRMAAMAEIAAQRRR